MHSLTLDVYSLLQGKKKKKIGYKNIQNTEMVGQDRAERLEGPNPVLRPTVS